MSEPANGLGLSEYEPFRESESDVDVLTELTIQHLKEARVCRLRAKVGMLRSDPRLALICIRARPSSAASTRALDVNGP